MLFDDRTNCPVLDIAAGNGSRSIGAVQKPLFKIRPI